MREMIVARFILLSFGIFMGSHEEIEKVKAVYKKHAAA